MEGPCGASHSAIYCAHCEVAALTKRIAELEAAARWIPVSERMPDAEITVIGTSNGSVETCCFSCGVWYQYGTPVEITHWRPLPTPPEAHQ